MKRILIITGHYGSGKTEFSVNMALKQAKKARTALVDLDVANVYFRSRERQRLMEESGIEVYSNTFNYDITADLPAIAASIRKPLEDIDCNTIIDVGGNESGARVLKQFSKYFTRGDSEMLCVINANRPETSTVEGALYHIRQIENETGLKAEGLVNNTHLSNQTRVKDILAGFDLCSTISSEIGIPVLFNCCTENLYSELIEAAKEISRPFEILPLTLHMRCTWMDL